MNSQTKHLTDFPLTALREIVLNAIIHRDYASSSDSVVKIFDNRIEFFNPGRLPDGLTVEMLLKGHYHSTIRNRKIADIFKEAGLVEKYGSGIKRILEAFREYNLPEPRFEEIGNGFMVTVCKKISSDHLQEETTQKTTQKTTRKTTQEIVTLIGQNPNITREELANVLSMTQDGIKYHLANLKKKGILRRIGPDKGGVWEVVDGD